MKYLRFIAAAAIIAVSVFSSCEKTEEQQLPPVLTLSVSGETITAPAAGGQISIPYKVANPVDGAGLSATADADWVTDIDVSSKENEIQMEVSPNPGDERSTKVKVSYTGAENVEITLLQMAAGEDIRISPEKIDADAAGDEVEVEVTSDRDWELSGEYSWVSVSASSGKSGDKVTFTITENVSPEVRTAEFTFTCASTNVVLTMTQAGKTILQSITDPTLKAYLLANADTDNDGEISAEEAAALKTIELPYKEGETGEIKSLEGLEYFTGLERIILSSHSFTEADFSMMPNLSYVDLSINSSLVSVSLKGCASLEYLTLALNSSMEEIDITGCTSLKTLIAYASGLKSVDVSECTGIESLTVYSTKIESLNLEQNEALVSLNAGNSILSSVVLPQTGNLEYLSLSGSSSLKSIDLSHCSNVQSLNVSSCPVSSLDLSECTHLSSLDITSCKSLRAIDVSKNLYLSSIWAESSNLNSVTMFEGQWDEIQSKCYGIKKNMITTVPIEYPEDCSEFIEDKGLRNYVISTYDSDGNGKISGEEAGKVTEITYSGKGLESFGSFVYFRNIERLDLSGNRLESINIRPFALSLTDIDLSGNAIAELSLEGAQNIVNIDISDNGMTSCTLDSDRSHIETINASHNRLTSFNCSYAGSLRTADLSYNELAGCDLEYSGSLTSLNVSHNHLTQETSSFVRPFTFTSIEDLDISYNDFVLTESDVTWTDKWTELKSFNCSGCAYLQEVDLSTNMNIMQIDALDCPRLSKIILNVAVNPQISKDSTTKIERQ